MGFFNKKSRLIVGLIIGVGAFQVIYTNCSNKSFTVSNETIQRLLSEGSSIYINNDDTYTNNTSVSLTIENNSATEMYVTNTKDCSSGGQWEPYATSKVWSLGETNVRTKAYVKFRESANGPESSCTWDSIIHDNTPPTLTIVQAAPTITNSPSLSFQFASADNLSGVKALRCKDQKGMALASCQEMMMMSGLAEGPGSATILAEDNAGNTSLPLTQTWLADFTAPRVLINSAPSVISNQMAGSFTFSGTDNYATTLVYECRLDGAAYATCTSPYNFNLNQGNHTFDVRAKDTAGNTSTVATYSWTIDLSAPTVRIISGPNAFSNSSTAQFTFDGIDDGVAITRFECKMDSGAFVNCNSPYSHSALANGSHTFQVRGYDGAGNASAPATYSWVIDTRAPQVQITSQPAKETNQSTATFQFVATDTETAIQLVECRVDGAAYQSCSNSMTYNNLAEGNHKFDVRATDLAGNVSAVSSYTWFVDLTAPTLSFVRTPNNPTTTRIAVFQMQTSDNSTSAILLECRLNSATAFSPCTRNESLNIPNDGINNFSVRATDAAGNTSATITHSWLLDTTGPAINFTQIPNSVIGILENPDIGFLVTDTHSTVAGVQCGLQGQMSSCPASHSVTYTTLTAGAYTFTVNAVDSLGNTSTNSIQFTVNFNIRPVSQTVTVTQNNKADILIVIDNSGSMRTEQANMASRFATFIDQLSSLDWRISIVTTDMSGNAYKKDGRFLIFDKTAFNTTNQDGTLNVVPDFYYIHSSMNLAAAKDSFGKTIQRPANEGSGAEQGIAASLKAIQRSQDPVTIVESIPNRDFFRSDAVLSVLVVTDANETNNSGTQIQNTPQNWVNRVQAIWPSKPFVFNSIVVRSGDSACLAINGNEDYGVSYETLSGMTGGAIGTVCAADYGSQLQAMGQAVVNLRRNVNLSCAPVNQNKNGTLLDDVIVTLASGANAMVAAISGQTVTLANDLPTGTHRLDYWCY
ncbi:hypothetical protein K2X05_09345 [bacterium]|nr:hypothetical protein [bacterium]